MKKSKFTKILAVFLTLAILFGTFSATLMVSAVDDADETVGEEESSSTERYGYTRTMDEVLALISASSYARYSERHADIPTASQSVKINAADAYVAEETTSEVEVRTNYTDSHDRSESKALYMSDEGKVTFSVDIPETGMYAIRITYLNVPGTNTTIERMLYIDGRLPFSEARYFYLPRMWTYQMNENGEFDKDVNGNDIRPVRTEVETWQDYYLRDWLGYSIDPFQFYFSEGTHTITLEAAREPILISTIEFYPYEEEAPYEEVLQGWLDQGLQPVTDVEPIKVQAENPDLISIQNMFPSNDRTSALSEPQDPAVIKYNLLDFGTVNQYAVYKIDVPKEGLYQINVRFRQNALIGLFSSRRIRVNGEVQFREASYLRFVYDTAFQVEGLNNGNPEDPFLFYLKEGENIIEFEAVLGDMTEYVYQIVQLIDELNDAYQNILMITGPSPDAFRDYGFERIAPEAIRSLAKGARQLSDIGDAIVEITGEMGDQVQTLDTISRLFKLMAEDEYEIASNLTNFKNYIVALSNWLYAALGQPLKMDYFTIQAQEDEKPAAAANFFQAAWFEMRAFVMSFFMDYTTIGFASEDKSQIGQSAERTLVMWAPGDRESSLITRRIIDTYFTPETGITVTIRVISAGLTEAILAGIGPDVAEMGATDTITWGLRTAVEPLENFSEFDETLDLFPEAATVPLRMYDKDGVTHTYGLPTAMSFNMMFYRLDVLAELGLDIPKTWDDLYDMMPVVQNKHLQLGLPTSLGGINIFLYQSGVELYADEGKRINLDSNEALSAFESLTDFFTKYSCPVAWEISRFRTGEIPIMIGDAIGTYNTLMSYAELRGLWEMAPLLGTVQADGSINNTSVAGVSSRIIPRGANDPELSWEYLKWQAQTDTAKKFINETIAVSAPTTKVASPNLEALLGQPWTSYEYEAISTQIKSLASIPEYPGGYIVGVYAGNAFMDVNNNHADPSNAMLDRILDINKEISRKRREFGMDAYDVTYQGSYKDQIVEETMAAAEPNE